MLYHERECIARRLQNHDVDIIARNAVAERAHTIWLKNIDAVIIGGSGDFSVHHPFSRPWINPLRTLIEIILGRSIPTFGICFGHQLLGYHLGAHVVTDPNGEEVGTVPITLTPAGKASPLFVDCESSFNVHTGHSDQIRELPKGMEVLATGETTPYQALQVKDQLIFSTQFHPDLTGEEARERYLSNKRNGSGEVSAEFLSSAEAFIIGQDVGTLLLGRFIDLINTERTNYSA